jgi:hypothetical protein
MYLIVLKRNLESNCNMSSWKLKNQDGNQLTSGKKETNGMKLIRTQWFLNFSMNYYINDIFIDSRFTYI